jgi:hypothetical protein
MPSRLTHVRDGRLVEVDVALADRHLHVGVEQQRRIDDLRVDHAVGRGQRAEGPGARGLRARGGAGHRERATLHLHIGEFGTGGLQRAHARPAGFQAHRCGQVVQGGVADFQRERPPADPQRSRLEAGEHDVGIHGRAIYRSRGGPTRRPSPTVSADARRHPRPCG